MKPTAAHLTNLLERLGNTAEEVAESLRAKSCTGYPRASFSCPVANYLREQLPDTTVSVGSGSSLAGSQRVRSPSGVSDFVRAFDNGLYPDLSKHTPRASIL